MGKKGRTARSFGPTMGWAAGDPGWSDSRALAFSTPFGHLFPLLSPGAHLPFQNQPISLLVQKLRRLLSGPLFLHLPGLFLAVHFSPDVVLMLCHYYGLLKKWTWDAVYPAFRAIPDREGNVIGRAQALEEGWQGLTFGHSLLAVWPWVSSSASLSLVPHLKIVSSSTSLPRLL